VGAQISAMAIPSLGVEAAEMALGDRRTVSAKVTTIGR
jgi:hypothetical protein